MSASVSAAGTPGPDLAGFDIYDHAVQDDPLPWYAALREQAPLFHNVEHDYWVLSRHEDVHWATREDAGLSNRMGVTLDASAWNEHAHLVMSFLAMDPPETTRLRRLVSRAFTPKRVRELAPTVEALTERGAQHEPRQHRARERRAEGHDGGGAAHARARPAGRSRRRGSDVGVHEGHASYDDGQGQLRRGAPTGLRRPNAPRGRSGHGAPPRAALLEGLRARSALLWTRRARGDTRAGALGATQSPVYWNSDHLS